VVVDVQRLPFPAESHEVAQLESRDPALTGGDQAGCLAKQVVTVDHATSHKKSDPVDSPVWSGVATRTGSDCCRSIRWFFSLGAFESSDGLPNCRILLAEFAERKLGSGGFGELQVCLDPGVS